MTGRLLCLNRISPRDVTLVLAYLRLWQSQAREFSPSLKDRHSYLSYLKLIMKFHHISCSLLESSFYVNFFFLVKEIGNLQAGRKQKQGGILESQNLT